jgi:predicted ATP-binding protein involved in virulence
MIQKGSQWAGAARTGALSGQSCTCMKTTTQSGQAWRGYERALEHDIVLIMDYYKFFGIVRQIMLKFIRTIQQNKINRKIDLDGSNMIIVGNNGAGKTSFLLAIKDFLTKIVGEQQLLTNSDLHKYISDNKNALMHYPAESTNYINTQNAIDYYNEILEQRETLNIDFCSNATLINEIKKGKFVFRFFDAYRRYSSNSSGLLSSVDELYEQFEKSPISNDVSNYFQRYLVSMSNYALIERGAGELDEYERVTKIILKMEHDLQNLFDDASIKLVFNRKKLTMEIAQGEKPSFVLENLPSGFASILAVYAELIMLAELSRTERANIRGVVLIDEIDAHLHVSVQKRVLEFFSTSFPNIQFIISTHSPFVIQSVSNAIIYNLSNEESLENLSVYSYTSIVKGLLGETSNSANLEDVLTELDSLSKSSNFGERYSELLSKLEDNYDVLDAKARAVVMSAKSRFVDWEEGIDNV